MQKRHIRAWLLLGCLAWSVGVRGQTVGFTGGTTGVGVVVGHTHQRFQFQVGYQGYRWQRPAAYALGDSQRVNIQPQIVIGQAMARVGYQVFPKRPRFHWVLGAVWDLRKQREAVFSTETGLTLSNVTISAEDFGEVTLGIRVPAFRAHTGFQWDIPLGKRVLWQNLVGTSYMGPMTLDANYTGFFETTNLKDDIKTIENNLRPIRYTPVYQMGLSWRIR